MAHLKHDFRIHSPCHCFVSLDRNEVAHVYFCIYWMWNILSSVLPKIKYVAKIWIIDNWSWKRGRLLLINPRCILWTRCSQRNTSYCSFQIVQCFTFHDEIFDNCILNQVSLKFSLIVQVTGAYMRHPASMGSFQSPGTQSALRALCTNTLCYNKTLLVSDD